MREQLAELWKYRELLYFLTWREVKIRYKQTAFGLAWAVIPPVFTMLVFTLFFGRLAKLPSDGLPYPLLAYSALLPWMYFSSVVSQASNSLVGNASLITKIYFPRVLLPAATVLSGLLDFMIGSVFLAALMMYYRVSPGWALLIGPLLVLTMLALTLAVSMLLAAVNVRYRDVKYAVPFVLQIWLFVTPIIYPTSIIPAKYQFLAALNPLWGLIDWFRAVVFPQHAIHYGLAWTSVGITVALFIFAAVYFHRSERSFADII